MNIMKHRISFISLFMIGIVFSQDCVSSDCHSDFNQDKYIHVPAEEEDCLACHEQINEKDKHPKKKGAEFALVEDELSDLCLTCHDIDIEGSEIHNPVADGECMACHDPHQSKIPNLLHGYTPGEVCIQCHQAGVENKEYIHGPVSVGACEVCHTSHGTKKNSLLIEKDVNTTCYGCHELKEEEIVEAPFQHDPAEESCSNCHDPHEADYEYNLIDETPSLCFECHDELSEQVESASSHHAALDKDNKCMNCHNPHGSGYESILKNTPFDLCLDCHDQPIKSGKTSIPSMKKFLQKKSNWHGPIKEKNCSGCHEPHGTNNIRLLRFSYPAEFYAPFDVANYELCFECHSPENVLNSNTAKLTEFRDGDRNLHYLHVNRVKGRTCRACHQTHASNLDNHIRESVPFGKWELPINYIVNETGGSCKPGCHKMKTYKRG